MSRAGADTTGRDLGTIRTVVIKIGSRIVLSIDLERLADDVQALRESGARVVIVSSGAVALGMQALGFEERPRDLPTVQALAAVGQSQLMNRYTAAFQRHGVCCAQLLLTHEDLSDRVHFLNMRHTLAETFELGVVPIINENDTVATAELRFGDNDKLAAAVGAVLDADLVIVLSDVDAVYDADPRTDPDARPIRVVEVVDDEIRSMAGASGSNVGTGGMVSKLDAALLSVEAEIPLVLAHGEEPGVISRIVRGETIGTLFRPKRRKGGLRRHWIGFLSKMRGRITVDAGAAMALKERGSSLLPIGVTAVEGHFSRGDGVTIVDEAGIEVARGLVGYDAAKLDRIKGARTSEAAVILQLDAADPVVHRNNMMLSANGERE